MERDFRPVQVYEGFDERYRAQAQSDIDNFVRYIGPAFSYPPVNPPWPLDPQRGMPFQASSTAHPGSQSPSNSNTVHSLAAQSQAAMSGSLDAAQQQFQRPQQHQQPLPWQQQMPPPAQQQQHQQQQHQSNIVPFQRRPKSSHIPEGLPGSIPGRFLDDDSSSQDTRPILLFDLNGTLTSHTAARHSSGKTLIRPGTHHLRRLQASLALMLKISLLHSQQHQGDQQCVKTFVLSVHCHMTQDLINKACETILCHSSSFSSSLFNSSLVPFMSF